MRKFSSTTKANSRQTLHKERLWLILGVGFAVLLILFVIPRFPGSAGALLFTPIAQFETWLAESSATIPSYFRDRKELLSEIESLRKENAQIRNRQDTMARLKEENAALRSLLGSASSTRIAAAVIGRPSALPYDVLMIDKGSRAGIRANAPVYAGEDQVIGLVAEVYSNSSLVSLATMPGFESTVYIFGPNIYTTAVGEGGGVLRVSVPQGIALEKDDIVTIPAFDTGIFGRVSHVESHPTEPEQRGYVTLPVPLQSIRYVSVGTAPLEPRSFEEASAVVGELRKDLLQVPVPSGVLVETLEDTGTTTATSSAATSTATATPASQ